MSRRIIMSRTPELSFLKRHPGKQEQRVVVTRRSSKAVIAARPAVEAQVPGVLHAEAQIDPGALERVELAERYELELHRVATRVGGAVEAPAERRRPEEGEVVSTLEVEDPESRAPGLVPDVAHVCFERVQMVRRLVGASESERAVELLALVNEGGLREYGAGPVVRGVLVGAVDGNVGVVVGVGNRRIRLQLHVEPEGAD